METKVYERFAVLDDERKNLESRIKTIREEMVELEKQLVEASMEEGIDKVTVVVGRTEDGLPVKRTVYRSRIIRAGHQGDMDALNQALKDAGLDTYVQEKVNMNSLSAYVREFDPDKNKSPEEIIASLPEPLKTVIKVSECINMKTVSG